MHPFQLSSLYRQKLNTVLSATGEVAQLVSKASENELKPRGPSVEQQQSYQTTAE